MGPRLWDESCFCVVSSSAGGRWQWCGGGAQSWTGFLCSWGRMDGERERVHECSIVCSLHICTDCLRQESSYTPIVLEKHLKEADMGFRGFNGGLGWRREKREGELLPGFQVCVNPFPAISQLTGNVLLKSSTSIPPGTLIDHSFSYLVFNNVLKTFSQRYQQMFSSSFNQPSFKVIWTLMLAQKQYLNIIMERLFFPESLSLRQFLKCYYIFGTFREHLNVTFL